MFDISTRTTALILVALLTGGILLARMLRPEPAPPAAPQQAPDAYSFLYSERFSKSHQDAAYRSLPFTAISITHDGCFGLCPVYTATIRLDGLSTYEGKEHVERVGRFTGDVDLSDFAQLCLLIERSGFMNLADRYAAPWTDDETVTVA